MIKTFADRQTEELFRTGKAKKVPADVARRALRKLEAVNDQRRICFRFENGDAYDVEFGDYH